MKDSLKIAIAGATGYIGLELVKILSKHPKVKILFLCASKSIGKSIYSFDAIKPDLILIDGRFRVISFFYVINFLKINKFKNTTVMIDDFFRKEYSIINTYFKVKKVGRIGYLKLKDQRKNYNLKNIERNYLFDPS